MHECVASAGAVPWNKGVSIHLPQNGRQSDLLWNLQHARTLVIYSTTCVNTIIEKEVVLMMERV